MATALGIVGSPRKGGNTEHLVSHALEAIKQEGLEVELIRLAGLDIRSCDGCQSCRKTLRCHIEDDVAPIFEKMTVSAAILVGSPVYFGSATPAVMALLQRAGFLAGAVGRPFERKVGGPLVVARRGGQNFTLAQLTFFFLHQGMVVPGSTYWNMAFGRERGEVAGDEEGLRTAWNFGKNVAWLVDKLELASGV